MALCGGVRRKGAEVAAPSLPALRTLPSGLLVGPHVAGERFKPEGSQPASCVPPRPFLALPYLQGCVSWEGAAAGEAAGLNSAEPFKAKMLRTVEIWP